MVNSLHTQANREKIINTQQSSGAPLPLRRLLAIEAQVAHSTYRNGKASKIASMVRTGRKNFLEAREQLRLLDAIEYGFISRVYGG